MDKSKVLTIVVAVLALIGVFLSIRVFMADDAVATDSATGTIVSYSILLLIIAAILAILFSVFNLIRHPAALKKSLLGIVGLAVLLLVAYFMASDAAVTDTAGVVLKNGEAGSISKWVSTLITFTGFLGVVGLALILLGFGKSLIK